MPLLLFGGSPAGADPWATLDGRSGAASGAAQLPTLLDTYHPTGVPDGRYSWPSTLTLVSSTGNLQQPPWLVAGVDYAVGARSSVTLRDPFQGLTPTSSNLHAELVAQGATAGGGGVLITFFGVQNITISGWDFCSATNPGGSGILVNCNNWTLTDCSFKVSSNNRCPIIMNNGFSGSGFTIQYCTVNGNKHDHTPSGSLIQSGAAGLGTIQYCYVYDAYYQLMSVGCTSGTSGITSKYNLYGNMGYGGPVGAHGDWIMLNESNPNNYGTVNYSFNTFFQTAPSSLADGQGLSYGGQAGTHAVANAVTFGNNTFVTLPTANVNFTMILDLSFMVNNAAASISQNYVDTRAPAGQGGTWIELGNFGGSSWNGTAAISGNVRMNTGATLTASST